MQVKIVAPRPARFALLGAVLLSSVLTPAFAQETPQRDVFFGETHVHTSWSFDAYVFGNMVTGPEDAYKYALGQPIKHPAGYEVQIKRPLDFLAVTDHSEYAGTLRLSSRSLTNTTNPVNSPPSRPTSGPQRRTTGTCTAISSSRIRRRCRHGHSVPSIRSIPRTSGPGWTASARRATSCWPSRITPT
jgi:Protein of unknown function (DUF3604)